ncbi:hypothetical protein BRADI_1g02615v3, partial [Brachypodium distachyon]
FLYVPPLKSVTCFSFVGPVSSFAAPLLLLFAAHGPLEVPSDSIRFAAASLRLRALEADPASLGGDYLAFDSNCDLHMNPGTVEHGMENWPRRCQEVG